MNPANETSAKSSFWQMVISFFCLLIFPVLLFFLSGDWRWTEGWIFSIVFFSLSFATVLYLYLKDPALLNERFGSPVQKEQKSSGFHYASGSSNAPTAFSPVNFSPLGNAQAKINTPQVIAKSSIAAVKRSALYAPLRNNGA